jgi:outer membrane protein OmpA-like peptidoglycan-associated protein
MKKALAVAGVLAVLPSISHAQEINPFPGFYVGAGAGIEFWLNSSTSVGGSVTSQVGFGFGALIAGYDFVGPRVEVEVAYGQVPLTAALPNLGTFYVTGRQLQFMGKLLYDFFPAAIITPYVGGGLGLALLDGNNGGLSNTEFAWQGILGLAWNIDAQWRIDLEGRYIGTTQPTVNVLGTNVSSPNNNIVAILGAQYKFPPAQAAAPPPPPTVQPTSFMVFFDWDRSNLSQQALATIQQAADAFRTKGSARIVATGHTDTSGPDGYNMALSLRRANAVKDALVRDGVPASAITAVGVGKAGLLVQTPDGVREPQNRRVEIVIQ